MKLLLSFLLLILVGCGDTQDIQNVIDDITGNHDSSEDNTPEPTPGPTPNSPEPSDSELNLISQINAFPRCYTPDFSSGFKCKASETRNENIVCLFPYYYTPNPRYTKTDHNGNSVQCNKDFIRFDKVTIEYDGKSLDLVAEDTVPYSNDKDYFCANYVGTAEGPIGRQHWRGDKTYDRIVKRSSNVKLRFEYAGNKGCIKVK